MCCQPGSARSSRGNLFLAFIHAHLLSAHWRAAHTAKFEGLTKSGCMLPLRLGCYCTADSGALTAKETAQRTVSCTLSCYKIGCHQRGCLHASNPSAPIIPPLKFFLLRSFLIRKIYRRILDLQLNLQQHARLRCRTLAC